MNSSLYPNNLWSGDIYIVSTATHEAFPCPIQNDPLLGSRVATYRFDNIPGTHALRTLQGMAIHDALHITGQLLAHCDAPMSTLLDSAIEALKQYYHNSISTTVGGFEDIILALSPESLQRVQQSMLNGEKKNAGKVLQEIQVNQDKYEQSLYTTLYQQLKTYAKWGMSDMKTYIHDEIDPTYAMICVVPNDVSKHIPGFWQALRVHHARLNKIADGNSRLHVDPNVSQCQLFEKVKPFTLPLRMDDMKAQQIAG